MQLDKVFGSLGGQECSDSLRLLAREIGSRYNQPADASIAAQIPNAPGSTGND
jgi:hypothetical protein